MTADCMFDGTLYGNLSKCCCAVNEWLLVLSVFTVQGRRLTRACHSMQDLLHAICSLSYAGDIRMGIAEDPSKVSRIVQGSLPHLTAMYEPMLGSLAATSPSFSYLGSGVWQQDTSGEQRCGLLSSLPDCVLRGIALQLGRKPLTLLPLAHRSAGEFGYWFSQTTGVSKRHEQLANGSSLPHMNSSGQLQPPAYSNDMAKGLRLDIAQQAVSSGEYQQLLSRTLSSTVWQSSFRQACAGTLMAGPLRSAVYLGRKLLKAWRH